MLNAHFLLIHYMEGHIHHLVLGLLPSYSMLLSSYVVSFHTYKYIYSQISFIRSHRD